MTIQEATDGCKHYVALLKLLRNGVMKVADEASCFDPKASHARMRDLDLDRHLEEYLEEIPEVDITAAEDEVAWPLREWAFGLASEALAGRGRKPEDDGSCTGLTGVLSTLPRSVTAAFGHVAALALSDGGRTDVRPNTSPGGLHGILFVHEQDHEYGPGTFSLGLYAFPLHADHHQMKHEEVVLFIDSCDAAVEYDYELTKEVAFGLAPVKSFYAKEKYTAFVYHGFEYTFTLDDGDE